MKEERKIGMAKELEAPYGCYAPGTRLEFHNRDFYVMTEDGLHVLQHKTTPRPSTMRRIVELVEAIGLWAGGVIFIVAISFAFTIVATMVVIGKWAISIGLLSQLFH